MVLLTSSRRPLHAEGPEVSPLGLGTVKLGRNRDVKYPDPYSIPDDATVRELLAGAKALGINLIDTAPAYGESEARLGALLDDRHCWVIATKVGETWGDGGSTFDFSAAATKASVDSSLARLRTDYLDLVLVHSDGNDQHLILETDVLAELRQLQRAGKVRAVGFSAKTFSGAALALQHVDVLMTTCELDNPESGAVIAKAAAAGCGVLVKKAFDSGHKPSATNLQRVLHTPGVSSVVVGTINLSHLRQDVSWVCDAETT